MTAAVTRLGALPAATEVSATDLFPVSQSGVTAAAPLSMILAGTMPASAAGTSVATLVSGKVPASQLPAVAGGDVQSVNGVEPDSNGNVALTAAQVGALPAGTSVVNTVNGHSGNVTLAAADVGALPASTALVNSVNGHEGVVTLAAGDVGALPANTAYVSSFNGYSGVINCAPENIGAINNDRIGEAGGVAALDGNGKVPLSQLYPTSGGVQSYDGRTGAVVSQASDSGRTGLVSLTPPLAARFSNPNQIIYQWGALSDEADCLLWQPPLVQNGNASVGDPRGQSCPAAKAAGTARSVVSCFEYDMLDVDFVAVGLAVIDSASRNFDVITVGHNSNVQSTNPHAHVVTVYRFTWNGIYWSAGSPDNLSTGYQGLPIAAARGRIFFRISEDGQGTRSYAWSSNGRDYITLATAPVGSVPGDTIGLIALPQQGTYLASVSGTLPPITVRVSHLLEV